MRSALLLTFGACVIVLAARLISPFAGALGGALLQGTATLLGFGGGAYLGLRVLDGDHRKIVPLRALGREQIYRLALLGVMLIAPVTLLCDIARTLLYGASAVNDAAAVGMQRAGGAVLLRLMASALIAPVCEELFFRGYLFGAMKRYSVGAAVAASAMCFALAHGMENLLIDALLGVFFALLTIRAESVYAPMIAHACYNLTLILISYSGASVLFDRLTLPSCALRLVMCAGFAHALRRFYAARPQRVSSAEDKAAFGRRDYWMLGAAAAAVLAAVLLSLLTGVTG